MTDVQRRSGVVLRLPGGVSLADEGREGLAARGFDFTKPILLDEPPDDAWGALRVALVGAGLNLVDTLDLVPSAPAEGVRALDPEILMDVPIEEGEDAALLADEDGVLTWVVPERDPIAAGDPSGLRGPAPTSARRFRLVVEPERTDIDGKRSMEWLTGWTGRRIKALVVRWATEKVAGLATSALVRAFEALRPEGLVWVGGADPLRWRHVPTMADTGVRQPRRVLLLVHGTFSSTLGCFGHLGHGPGAAALRLWLESYDLVVGFDHHTLAKAPDDNARAILDAMREAAWPDGTHMDIVCHSRGGLVARTLVERLLPASGLTVEVGNIVCVATTNAGTLLARPENWKHLIDLTKNLATAACRAMAVLAPPTALAAAVLGETVSGVSVVVKALATAVLEQGDVPGLQAMDPDGDFVRSMSSGPTPNLGPATRYLAVTSDFETGEVAAHRRAASGLPPRLVTWAADALVDRLFQGAPNDLVVHTASTRTIHPGLMDRLSSAIDLRDSPDVYHLNYFASETTARRICELTSPDDDSTVRSIAPFAETGPGTSPADGDARVDLYGEATSSSGAVEVGRRLSVVVTLRREPFEDQPSPSSARAGARALPEEPLLVTILPRRGLAVEGDSVQTVPMPNSGAPEETLFVLRAVEALDAPAEVFVQVRQGADRLMKLELGIRVVPAGQPVVAASVTATAAPPIDRGTPAAAQLEARLRRGMEEYELDLQLDVYEEALRESYSTVRLPLDLRAGLERTFGEIETVWARLVGRPDAFEAHLRGLGALLAEQLLPAALRARLWERRDALRSLELETDEPFIPWELLYIEGPNGNDGLFLAELGFTRAMRGAFCPDAIRMRRHGRFTVVPRYPGKVHLDFALDEESWLAHTLGAHPVDVRPPDRASDLRHQLADGGPVDLLHYAGHGQADESEVYLVMGGDTVGATFTPQLFASVAARPIHLNKPDGGRAMVFLNACQAGRRVAALAGERSWARTFLVLGEAGVFVAPLWSVGDSRAGTFARALYEALLRGDTFAEASRSARSAARRAGDPTWLSYAVYASPHARVVFES